MAAGTGNPRLSRYAEDRRQHQLITGKIKFLVLFLTAFFKRILLPTAYHYFPSILKKNHCGFIK